jgi:hypothetical protein
VLGDDAPEAALVELGKQPVAVLERLRVTEGSNAWSFYKVPEASLAIFQGHAPQVVSVELHEVECPQHEPVRPVLMDAPMQRRLEAILVHELGVDNRRGAGDQRQALVAGRDEGGTRHEGGRVSSAASPGAAGTRGLAAWAGWLGRDRKIPPLAKLRFAHGITLPVLAHSGRASRISGTA